VGSIFRSLLIWVVIIVAALLLFSTFNNGKGKSVELSYTEFLELVDKGEVINVTLNEAAQRADGKLSHKIKIKGSESDSYFVYIGSDPEMYKSLKAAKTKVDVKPPETLSWTVILINVLPFLLLFVLGYMFIKQMQGAGNSAFSFSKSRAKLFSSNQSKVTFQDVAGVDEAKEELKEVIGFLKEPGKYQKMGAKIPKGVLLLGAPGTGKTLLARAVAGEAGVPFFTISGSDFVELFVGVGAARVRDLFDTGKKNAPCIIFIDELDAVGRRRGTGIGGGHDEREQTLNQLLVEMDGFDANVGVIIMAATNRADVLDFALLRPGRFDRQVVVDAPDLNGREMILQIHTKKVPLGKNIDLRTVAKGTPGFTGADLANLVNESALLAARKDKKEIEQADFEEARDKVMMGIARKSKTIGEKEKKITAYHEAGHALINKLLPDAEPLHKVSIIPRGRALGVTWRLPVEDRWMRMKGEYMNDIMISLGGRVVEEIFFEDVSTGAASDLRHVTETAHKMVCEFGMSVVLGNRTFGRADREVFLGGEYLREKDYSELTAQVIDAEVKKVTDECYKKAKALIMKNKSKVEKLAKALLDKETLDGSEVDTLLGFKSQDTYIKEPEKKTSEPLSPAQTPAKV